MAMEQVMVVIENKMKKTDEKLDVLAVQVGNIENEILSEDGAENQVNDLLRSVYEVKANYQNLREELMEVRDLQKQLSSSLQFQLKMMQTKFDNLKEKIVAPPSTTSSSSSSSSSSTSSAAMLMITGPKSPGNQN